MFGKVHGTGEGAGVLCRLSLEGSQVVATEHRVDEAEQAQVFRFPLADCDIAYGGADEGKLVFTHHQLILYAEREEVEPAIKALGLSVVDQALQRQVRLRGGRRRKRGGVWLGLLLGCVLVAWGALAAADWAVGRAVAVTPPSWEVQLGQTFIEGQDWEEVQDPAVLEEVQKITDRVLKSVGEHPYEFRFKVVRDPAVNAFAAPGGSVVILTGLLEKAESPEEVAGVLAHEIQHVLARHSLRGIYDRLKWHLLVAAVVGDTSGTQELLLAQGVRLMQLSYGREMERQADRRGVDLLVKANIDPQGLHDFFEKLALEEALPESLTILSTHPSSRERQDYLKELIDRRSNRGYEPLDIDWEGLQQRLEGGAGD